MRNSLPLLVVALTLAACANDRGPSGHAGPSPQHGQGGGPPPEGGPNGGPGQSRPARGALFISPMGEPFRGTEGGAPMARWVAGADTNNDGQISVAEFNHDALRFFATLDANKDGRINADEIKHYEDVVVPEVHSAGGGGGKGSESGGSGGRGGGRGGGGGGGGGKGGDGGGGGGGKGGGGGGKGGSGKSGSSSGSVSPNYGAVGAARFGLLAIPQPVSSADSNFDGSVSQTEFTRAAAQRFALLDTNANGTLTRDELTRDK